MPANPNPAPSAWAGLRRSAIYVALLCTAIALLLTVIDQGGLAGKLVYSFSIGICCWIVIAGGRHGATHLLNRLRLARGQGAAAQRDFPGWGWMAALTLLGVALGPMAGIAIGDLITGHRSPGLFQLGSPSAQVTLAVTVLASLASLFTLTLLERLASARAQAEAAQRTAVESRLRLLESQLEPHMLFNTLANLRVLIAIDPARAQDMLDRLIGFLRGTLAASRATTQPLLEEFSRLQDYLALMQVRMGERLQVRFELPKSLAATPVPPLLLQPLVENSIRHGIEPRLDGGRIEVSAARDAGQLLLQVRDTGIGLAAASSGAAGFGLQQVRERLFSLYGSRARFELEAAGDAEGGVLARVRIPLDR